jgi:hypothetical protein
MAVSSNIKVIGVKEAIRSLNKIEPGLRKEFTKDAARIAQPAIQGVQNAYKSMPLSTKAPAPLSGMTRNWTQSQSKKFPFSLRLAVNGVKLKVDASYKAVSVIYIAQMNAGAAIFEAAGRKNPGNQLAQSLTPVSPGRTRIIGPAVYRQRPKIEGEMKKSISDVVARVQRELY